MSDILSSSLSVTFDDSAETSSKIVLKQITKNFFFKSVSGKNSVILRVYPSDVTQIYASVGEIEMGGVYSTPNQFEVVKFTGGKTASLKYPGVSNVRMELLGVAVQRIKNQYGVWEIKSCYPTFIFKNEQVVANIEFYGACKVLYDVSFKVFYYRPGLFAPFGGIYGAVATVGSIFALKGDAVETLDIELDTSDPKNRMEYARVSSKVILDPLGLWEYPDNWGSGKSDEDGTWSVQTTTHTIDPDNCFEDTRVHEIIYININGRIEHECFNNGGVGYHSWYPPYSGVDGYQPKYTLNLTSPPGWSSQEDFIYDQTNTTWRDIFLDVDLSSLLSDLRERYPGLTGS